MHPVPSLRDTAHDLNNLVTVLVGAVEYLDEWLAHVEELSAMADAGATPEEVVAALRASGLSDGLVDARQCISDVGTAADRIRQSALHVRAVGRGEAG